MQVWEEFVALQEIELGAETVRKWLKTLKIMRFDAANLYLEATDAFHVLWFEEHIRKKVQASLFNQNKRRLKVHLSIAGKPSQIEKPKRKKEAAEEQKAPVVQPLIFDALDPLATFEHFVVTESHEVPYKLLKQLGMPEYMQQPALYNPIFLCGPAGCGKTHLLKATSHFLRSKGLSVIYARAETFTEHVVSAIRASNMSLFRQSYRNADVLIIDDVHSLEKKWATQEELFHTFNTLHLSGKQIILSANSLPNELSSIEPRLISRFEWGIVLPIPQLSKIDLKRILEMKCRLLDFPLHASILDFFVENFSNPTSICRALEALILRVHLKRTEISLTSTQLTTAFIQHQLKDLLIEERDIALSPEKIVKQVADYFGIRAEDILGKAKSREYVLPRQIAMYICRIHLQLPFTQIGEYFSKDHSTVMASVKRVEQGIDQTDAAMATPLHFILKQLRTSRSQ